VHQTQPLAAAKHWRWELEGDIDNEELARSPWLTSREECFAVYHGIRTAFETGQVEAVAVPADQPGQVQAARPRSV